jgi:Domain of unknown function (DUF6867)
MTDILAVSWPVFIGLTVVLFGGAAFLMGQALGETWRPAWQNVAYGLLLTVGDRLAGNFLFGSYIPSISGYVTHAVLLIGIALAAHRLTLARKMVNQYPWLYERTGPFGWREVASKNG